MLLVHSCEAFVQAPNTKHSMGSAIGTMWLLAKEASKREETLKGIFQTGRWDGEEGRRECQINVGLIWLKDTGDGGVGQCEVEQNVSIN